MSDREDGPGALATEAQRQRVVDHYERQLSRFGATPRGMDWKDAASQRLRFEVLCGGFDLEGATLHEVGAGAGHLYDMLREQKIDVTYSGSDRSPEMVAVAGERHPDAQFVVRDVLAPAPNERYDYVICSGLFNVKLDCPDRDWARFVESAIHRMYEMCSSAIAFNLMSDRVDYRVPELHYSDPEAMVAFCRRSFGPHVSVSDDYPLYEYTVHVHRHAPGD